MFVGIFIGLIVFLFFIYYDAIDNYIVGLIIKAQNDRLNKMEPYIKYEKLFKSFNSYNNSFYLGINSDDERSFCKSRDYESINNYEIGYLFSKFRNFIGYNINMDGVRFTEKELSMELENFLMELDGLPTKLIISDNTRVTIEFGVNYTNSNLISIKKFVDEWYIVGINGFDGNSVKYLNFKCDGFDGVKNLIMDIL